MTPRQAEFLDELQNFIDRVISMPRFKGQTQAVSALRRISKLSALNK